MVENVVRVFVGGISFELSKTIGDLESRISKYGEIVKSFDIHHNKVQDVYFGFVTLDISDTKMKSLKRVLNGAKFKGSTLIIDIAKPDWKENWERDARRQDRGIKQRKLRAMVTAKRIERIEQGNMNPFKLALVSKGRMRTSKRKCLKNLTIRIEIKGRVRIVKCKKSKLWGIAKNRGIKDLTARFIAGEWRDGNEHVIDRLTKKIIIFDNSGIKVQDYKTEEPVEGELQEEKEKTNLILEGLLSKYDFDRPLALQEEEDEEKAGSDYELQRHNDSGEEEEVIDVTYMVPEKDCVKPSQESIVKQYLDQHKELLDKPILPLPKADEEEDNDDEFYKSLTTKFNYDAKVDNEAIDMTPSNNLDERHEGEVENRKNDKQDHEDLDHETEFFANFGHESKNAETENVEEKSEEEFIPSFGGKTNNNETKHTEEESEEEDEFIPTFGNQEPALETKNNITETLRALLNPVNVRSDVEEVQSSGNIIEEGHNKRNLGLFFGHFESPFLVAQSQINKFNDLNVEQELQWDKWFWENRGELNREFRRRRRDVLKRNRKNNSKAITI